MLGGELTHPLCFDISSKRDLRSIKYSTYIRPIYELLIMKSYKKIGLSHEMGLIDTPPLIKFHRKMKQNERVCHTQNLGSQDHSQGHNPRSKVCH